MIRRQLITFQNRSVDVRVGLGAFDELSRMFASAVGKPKRAMVVWNTATSERFGEVVEHALVDAGFAVSLLVLDVSPAGATLADADTVALLLDKLGDTDSAWRTALLEKETEIAAQRQEVAAINARIAGELFPAEKLGAGDRAALEEVIAEIEALPEADRAYVTGAGGLYAARERLDRTQTGRTVGIIAAAAAVIAAAAIVLIIIKKKKAASHTEEIKTKETGK